MKTVNLYDIRRTLETVFTAVMADMQTFFSRLQAGEAVPEGGRFFQGIRSLPETLRQTIPVLADIANLGPSCPDKRVPGPGSQRGIVSRRLERRYLRIRFVQQALEGLDFSGARPGADFQDLVFEQADFSAYRRIPADEFTLFSGEGLMDYRDDFFERAFRLNRNAAEGIIGGAYIQEEDMSYYRVRDERFPRNPLFASMMRTLHSSLDFAPLLSREEPLRDCVTLLSHLEAQAPVRGKAFFSQPQGRDRLFYALLMALHRGGITHQDGMKTDFSTEKRGPLSAVLRGTFRPGGKACTIDLASC